MKPVEIHGDVKVNTWKSITKFLRALRASDLAWSKGVPISICDIFIMMLSIYTRTHNLRPHLDQTEHRQHLGLLSSTYVPLSGCGLSGVIALEAQLTVSNGIESFPLDFVEFHIVMSPVILIGVLKGQIRSVN